MFNPTKAHEKEIIPGQSRIRMGDRVPPNAVSLAYVHVPPLTPAENVQIADTSSFVLENVSAGVSSDLFLWPDESHLLRDISGNAEIESQIFLLTNVFRDGVPLYFVHRLSYWCYDEKGPDANGFYQGSAIVVVDKDGKPVNGEKKVAVRLHPTDQANLYAADVYTNFQTKPGEEYRIIYNAVDVNEKGERTIWTHAELLNAQPAFTSCKSLEDVKTCEAGYYRAQDADLGYARVYVKETPILDSRQPVRFRFQITCTVQHPSGARTLKTPWIDASVLHENSLTPADTGYANGYRTLFDSAEELVRSYYKGTEEETWLDNYPTTYTIEADTQDVSIDTRIDGNGPVVAKAKRDTGTIALPLHYRTEDVAVPVSFSVNLFLVETGTGQKHLAQHIGPFTIRQSDGEVSIWALNYAAWSYPEGYQPDKYVLVVEVESPTAPVTLVIWDENEGRYRTEPIPCQEISVSSRLFLKAKTHYTQKLFSPTYALRPKDRLPIRVLPPLARSVTENWYLRIQNGRFYRTVLNEHNQPEAFAYFLPEYYRQPFAPEYGYPYRQVVDERPDVVGERMIRLRHTPLFIELDAQTRKPRNISIRINDIPVSIRAWDAASGTVELDSTVRDTDNISVTYYYEETAYEYRGFWDEKNKRFWHLDLNPGKGHVATQYDKATDEIRDLPTSHLLNKTIYLYLRPASRVTNVVSVEGEEIALLPDGTYQLKHPALKVFGLRVYTKRTGQVIKMAQDPSAQEEETTWEIVDDGYVFTTIRLNNPQVLVDDVYVIDYAYVDRKYRVIPGTYQPHALFHTFEEVQEPNVILLAKVQIRPNSSKDSIRLIDTRRRGGGIKETIGPALMKELGIDSRSYWDIGYWDGEPYQENGVLIIRLPRYILKEYGGRFTKQDVEAVVQKHIAFGTFTIIDYLEEPMARVEMPSFLHAEIVEIPRSTTRELLAPEFSLEVKT